MADSDSDAVDEETWEATWEALYQLRLQRRPVCSTFACHFLLT